jgi:hypothetical protein
VVRAIDPVHGVKVVGVEIDFANSLQANLVAVRRWLNAIGEPSLQAAHERNAGVLVELRALSPAAGNGIFGCGDRRSNPPFCLAETDTETGANSKKPAVRGTNARSARGVRYLKTGWWCAQSDTNRSPVAIPC